MKPILFALAFATALTTAQHAHAADATDPGSAASKIAYHGAPRYLAITGLAARQQNTLLTLNVEFTNTDREDQEAFYRVSWLDGDGFPAWEPEAWKPVLLHGREQRSVLIVAPSAKATDFRIHFSATANSALGD